MNDRIIKTLTNRKFVGMIYVLLFQVHLQKKILRRKTFFGARIKENKFVLSKNPKQTQKN